MFVFVYGSVLFLAAFILHFAVWKIRLPRRQTRALGLIFLGVLFVGVVLLYLGVQNFISKGLQPPVYPYEYIQIGLYFISLLLAYTITYSAIEADSPSLLIIMKIAKAGEKGLEEETLDREMDDKVLIEPRIRDLLKDGMAELQDGKYRLKPKGILMASLFTIYRNIMGLGKGG